MKEVRASDVLELMPFISTKINDHPGAAHTSSSYKINMPYPSDSLNDPELKQWLIRTLEPL
jgi:hypothetical protein